MDTIRQTESPSGFLTLTEVLAGIERRVAAFRRGHAGREMTPQRWQVPRSPGSEKGTLVFINPNRRVPNRSSLLEKYFSPVYVSKGPETPDTIVSSLLSAYQSAYEARSIRDLLEVYPDFSDTRTLQKKFNDVTSVRMAIGP